MELFIQALTVMVAILVSIWAVCISLAVLEEFIKNLLDKIKKVWYAISR